MDVRFINPFLYGTVEVLTKMAFLEPKAGKPYAKRDDTARGDISGIIGMTGDAVGSLAITFEEHCIMGIAGNILGENITEMNKLVFDSVGELTNMISGASRKLMEKENLKVFAAIPTIVYGKGHTVRHIIKGPSIVIPFKTDKGEFVLDVCLRSQLQPKEEQAPVQQPATSKADEHKAFDAKALKPAVFGKPSMPQAGPGISQEKIDMDLNKSPLLDQKDVGERLVQLKKILAETISTRDAILKQMKEQPFMEYTQRMRYKKAIPAYDAKIKRMKLDISAAETIAKMSNEDYQNPTIKPHFQHYPNVSDPKKK